MTQNNLSGFHSFPRYIRTHISYDTQTDGESKSMRAERERGERGQREIGGRGGREIKPDG